MCVRFLPSGVILMPRRNEKGIHFSRISIFPWQLSLLYVFHEHVHTHTASLRHMFRCDSYKVTAM